MYIPIGPASYRLSQETSNEYKQIKTLNQH